VFKQLSESLAEHQHILGGVIEATENRSLAFFLTKHSLVKVL
jgi:hypothetical protein